MSDEKFIQLHLQNSPEISESEDESILYTNLIAKKLNIYFKIINDTIILYK